MIKKKLNILLLPLLALLFINLFSISYARSLTETEIKNFCYNLLNRGSYSDSENQNYKNNISNIDLSYWANLASGNNFKNKWYIYGSGYTVTFVVFEQNIYETTQNGQRAFQSTGGNYWSQQYQFNQSSVYNWNTTNIKQFGNPTMYYFDCNVYTNSSLNSVSVFAGSFKPNDRIFNENESSNDYFSFLLNSSLPTMIISNNSVPYYNLQTNQADSFVLGQLGLAKNFSFAELDSYRYQNGDWKHVSTNTLYNIGTTTNDLISVTIPGSIINSNTLYTLTMYSAYDSDFSNISQPFYITDRNTIITNGALNVNDTFSGDYYNNYNNDTNTDKIIDNINDDTQVDNTLNNFISGDAENIANKFGFRLFNQEYYNFIHDTIVSLTDVLTEEEDVYFDYSMHGESPTRIYASSFTTPNGTLKTFLSMFLISCTVFAFYKYISDLLELISTGNILEALDEFKVDRNIFKM